MHNSLPAFHARVRTPLGDIRLGTSTRGLCRVEFVPMDEEAEEEAGGGRAAELLASAARQLRAWFTGDLRRIDLPLDLQGTELQKHVWAGIGRIPYGQVRTTADFAASLGLAPQSRIVLAAIASNPVPLILPCHRILTAGGRLRSWPGTSRRQRSLLDHEQRVAGGQLYLFT